MAKPAILQDLLHGKILSKKVFPDFVETWNYIIHRCQNLRGDGDINPATGYIKVDNTNPDFPVIRYSPPVEMNSTYRADSDTLSAYSLDLYRNIIVSDDMSADCGSIFGLHDFDSLSNQVKPSPISAYDMVTRYIKNGIPYVKYVALSSLSATGGGDNVKGDSEVTNLSSIETFELSDDKVVRLYKFDEPDEDFNLTVNNNQKNFPSSYKFLVRDGDENSLRYANLCIDLSNTIVSGDSNLDDSYSITAYQKEDGTTGLKLYNFDNTNADYRISVNFQNINFCTSYWKGWNNLFAFAETDNGSGQLDAHFLNRYWDWAGTQKQKLYYNDMIVRLPKYSLGDSNYSTWSSISSFVDWSDTDNPKPQYELYNFQNPDRNYFVGKKDFTNGSSNYKLLVRDAANCKLRYANLSGFEVSGDANIGGTRSISSYMNADGQTVCELYNFEKSGDDNVKLTVDYDDYYASGSQEMKPVSPDDTTKFIVRTSDTGVFETDYKGLSIEIPPFVHGDSDSYVHGDSSDTRSIESVTHSANPTKSYYQLYDWTNSSYGTSQSEMLSDKYVDLATGTRLDQGNHYYQFLVRNTNTGDLEYKQVSVKGDGAGSTYIHREITEIHNDITNITYNTTVLCGDYESLSGDLENLTDRVDDLEEKLSGSYWEQGGSSDTCYGSAIGNSKGNTVINLSTKELQSSWTAANDFLVGGSFTAWDGLLVNQGGATIWGNTQINGNITTTGNLQIGNTTLSESQLQRLLQLI